MMRFLSLTILFCLLSILTLMYAAVPAQHEPKHFPKVFILILENMSVAEVQNAPVFKKLLENSGYGHNHSARDAFDNGYALIGEYYNNLHGGSYPVRPSQLNYIALTSGATQTVKNNENHNLNVDNLAAALNDAGIQWRVYAENLPDPVTPGTKKQQGYNDSGCFIHATSPLSPTRPDDGYQRKHEPFISYLNIQNDHQQCKKIINAAHLKEDLPHMPQIAFYIPNQIHAGHNGYLAERVNNVNQFLATMLGFDPATGAYKSDAQAALLQKYMADNGLLIIMFDEPSVTGNRDNSMFMLLAGKQVESGVYPDAAGRNGPICYPPQSVQNQYPTDLNGFYAPTHCNHYNVLRLLEENWSLRRLSPEHTSAGYKNSLPLDNQIENLWRS